jgi:DNA-directed RNA polymerase subunit H (RpoH/RPB5)
MKPTNIIFKIINDMDYKFTQIVWLNKVVIDITKHKLVLKHIKLSETEIKSLLEEYRLTTRVQLPMMLRDDPISHYMDLHIGDVCKIIHDSPTSGVYCSFRVVKYNHTKIYMSKIKFDKDFFIFSTHKTSTQSLTKIFDTGHIHCLLNAKYTLKYFLEDVEKYYKLNNRKLKILTTLRTPSKRVISSYFQIKHDKEINQSNIKSNKTTVMKNNVNYLVKDIESFITNKEYPGESLYEIMKIFDFNFNDVEINKKDNYGYYENNLIQLYVLNFDHVISDNNIKYLTNIFKIKLIKSHANRSIDKPYYAKYKQIQQIFGNKFDDIVNPDHEELIALMKKIE